MSIYLGVNIDHVATLRQARKTRYSSPVEALLRYLKLPESVVVARTIQALGNNAAATIPIRCARRMSPFPQARMASPRICARTGATSRMPTWRSCARC